ncbi:MAG: hypothetical protein NT133_02980 [Alphaproteobacteria bacterium]|nr:hypothetical protein [Alphaproteobacteria bacterium]
MAVLTVMGAAGGTFSIPFANFLPSYYAGTLADSVGQEITNGTAVLFTVDGSPIPAVPAGKQLVVYDTLPIAISLPDTVPAVLFSNATGVTTVTSGAISGDVIVVGDGGINFTAGAGFFNLIAGNGDAVLNLAPGVAGGAMQLASGNATINAIGGNNSIYGADGNHVLSLGIGTNAVFVDAGSSNTITGGPGNIVFNRGYNLYGSLSFTPNSGTDVVLFGSGNNSFASNDDGAAVTIASSSGSDTISTASYSSSVYFAGSGSDIYNGAGTVVGGSGTLLAQLHGPGMLMFAGTGATGYNAYSGSSTVVGNPAGAMSLFLGGGNVLLFAQGRTTLQGGDADTVLGIGGSLDVVQASGLFLAAPGGNSHINVTGNATVFGVAAGDVLSSSDPIGAPYNGSATNALVGGAGAETISGAGSTAINLFFAGSGPEFIQAGDWNTSIVTGTGAAAVASGAGISLTAFVQGRHPDVVMQGFTAGKDYLTLINFGTGEAAAALAGAQTVAGSEVLTLSDGTHITFQGFTGLTTANIL